MAIVYNVICCMGEERHLWYLPSLFWIFMIAWILNKAKIGDWLSLIISILFALLYKQRYSLSAILYSGNDAAKTF